MSYEKKRERVVFHVFVSLSGTFFLLVWVYGERANHGEGRSAKSWIIEAGPTNCHLLAIYRPTTRKLLGWQALLLLGGSIAHCALRVGTSSMLLHGTTQHHAMAMDGAHWARILRNIQKPQLSLNHPNYFCLLIVENMHIFSQYSCFMRSLGPSRILNLLKEMCFKTVTIQWYISCPYSVGYHPSKYSFSGIISIAKAFHLAAFFWWQIQRKCFLKEFCSLLALRVAWCRNMVPTMSSGHAGRRGRRVFVVVAASSFNFAVIGTMELWENLLCIQLADRWYLIGSASQILTV